MAAQAAHIRGRRDRKTVVPAMSFRITGLLAEAFRHLFALSDEELAAHNAVRRIADDRSPGYPCRVSLTDSKPGYELILVNYGTERPSVPYSGSVTFQRYLRHAPRARRISAHDPGCVKTLSLLWFSC
jgi:hypothetical protein